MRRFRDGKDTHHPGSTAVTSRAGRDSVQGSHHGRHGGGESHSGDVPAEPDPEISRPNSAPAYHLDHPARLWITVCARTTGPPPPFTPWKPPSATVTLPGAPDDPQDDASADRGVL